MQISFNKNTSGKTNLIWSDLCTSSPGPLQRLATHHFDERYKRKQSTSFFSQPEHTIWVSRHRTLRTQYLHLAYLRPFVRYQGKNLDLFWKWCCFKVFLHCLVKPNQVIQFLFHFHCNNQNMNLSSNHLVLCMLS